MHRFRVEHMERQLANLTGLVQKALVQNPQITAGAPQPQQQQQPFMQTIQGPYRNGELKHSLFILQNAKIICKKKKKLKKIY